MAPGDRGLQLVRTGRAGRQGLGEQGRSLGDLGPVPPRAVLVRQQDQVSCRADRAPRRASVSSSNASSPVTSASPGTSAVSARARLIAWSHRSARTRASPAEGLWPTVKTR